MEIMIRFVKQSIVVWLMKIPVIYEDIDVSIDQSMRHVNAFYYWNQQKIEFNKRLHDVEVQN